MGRTPPPFLGRTEELKALESRCARPGLTIVKGPPKIGKTTLLKEFVKRSRAGGHRQIGMGEAAEAGGDVLLRAIKDAYSHWLSEDGARAELQSIHAQMKGKYISEVGTAVGVALAECTGPAKGLVGAVFKGLESAKRKVDTGGLTVPRLTSEEARDLLAILAAGQDRPVVAVLNQWEEGQDLDKDTATLRTFLAGLDDWPDFHVVVHLRDPRLPRDRNKEAEGFAATLLEHPAVRALSVGLIEFGMDEVAYPKLMQWLAAHFPAFNAIEHIDTLSDSALEMIGGNPAVLDEWSYLDDDHRVDLERLGEVADDARSLQYPELWTIYRTLLTEARADSAHVPALEVALLAAALPLPPDAEEQAVILPAVLGLATEGDLARLESEDLLRPEGGLRLNLGHSSRREAAERGILGQSERFCKLDGGLARDLKPYLRRAVDRVVPALTELHPAGAWSRLDPETQSTAALLAATAGVADACDAGQLSKMLCASARTLFRDGYEAVSSRMLTKAVSMCSPPVRCLVTIGLNNALFKLNHSLPLAIKMLDVLRVVRADHPRDCAARDHFAMGLFNTLNNAEADAATTSELVEELRALRADDTESLVAREQLSKGLSHLIYRNELTASELADVLVELRTLHAEFSGDRAVLEQLAHSLNNAIHFGRQSLPDALSLLHELRELHAAHGQNRVVLEDLAMGLLNAINRTDHIPDAAPGMLAELRQLYADHPGNDTVRRNLGMALYNCMHQHESDSRALDDLYNELQRVQSHNPEDDIVRSLLAQATALLVAVAMASQDTERAATRAEALCPLRDAVLSATELRPLFQRTIDGAAEGAATLGDTDAERRLRAVYETLFGGDDGPDAPAEPAPPTPEA